MILHDTISIFCKILLVAEVNFSVAQRDTMSSQAFQDIISGPLTAYLTLSSKIGGEVAAHAKLVGEAFQ